MRTPRVGGGVPGSTPVTGALNTRHAVAVGVGCPMGRGSRRNAAGGSMAPPTAVAAAAAAAAAEMDR